MLEFYSTCDQGTRNNTPGFAVAQHFNSTGHSISDVQVRGVALCSGTNIQRKQREMRLIFHPGTVQPKGLNINFSFIWIGKLYRDLMERKPIVELHTFYASYWWTFTTRRYIFWQLL